MSWRAIGRSKNVISDAGVRRAQEALSRWLEVSATVAQPKPALEELLTALWCGLRNQRDCWQPSSRMYLRSVAAQLAPALTWVRSRTDPQSVGAEMCAIFEAAIADIAALYRERLLRAPHIIEILGTFAVELQEHAERYADVAETTVIQRLDPGLQAFRHKREALMVGESTAGYVQGYEDAIAETLVTVQRSETPPAQRELLRKKLVYQHLWLLVARYSRGEQIAGLRKDFLALVDALDAYLAEPYAEVWSLADLEAYVAALWLVSWGYLLEVERAVYQKLLALFAAAPRDALFDRLVHLKVMSHEVSDTLLHPQPYRLLVAALDASREQQAALVQDFLKQYYAGMQQTSWHDLHLRAPQQFFGYWCFELSACVKGFEMDDLAFANHYYYPRDLTGRYLFRTWDAAELGARDRALYRQRCPEMTDFLILHGDAEE